MIIPIVSLSRVPIPNPFIAIVVKADLPRPPKIQHHTITTTDSLISIAESYHTTAQRLFNKNLWIIDPNIIITGEVLVIPQNVEVLPNRPFPLPPEPVTVILPPSPVAPPTITSIGTNASNYEWGNCTWGVATWINVPAGLGNANQWATNAQAMGYTVSSVPTVGSVGQTSAGEYGHVVLVTGISGSSVDIKEMNAPNLGETTYRTVPTSDFVYIYFN